MFLINTHAYYILHLSKIFNLYLTETDQIVIYYCTCFSTKWRVDIINKAYKAKVLYIAAVQINNCTLKVYIKLFQNLCTVSVFSICIMLIKFEG